MAITAERHPVVPNETDISQARDLSAVLSLIESEPSAKTRCLLTDGRGKAHELSNAAFEVLVEALKAMAKGKAIMLVPVEAELSTQEAADLLNVSRPYLVQLLDSGQIKSRKVGRYRRVRFQDIIEYQEKLEKERESAMDELVAQAQELKLGY